ncbi:MAG: type II toxin-antitoxin system VapC family toxin [Thermofilum sp.]
MEEHQVVEGGEVSRALYVADASVFASIIVKDEFHERATDFVRRYSGRLATLDLAVVEVANALWRHAWLLGRIPGDRYEKLSRNIKPLVLGAARLYPAAEFLEAASSAAYEYSITVYDALYVALAQHLECRLASFDGELKRRLENAGVIIVEAP